MSIAPSAFNAEYDAIVVSSGSAALTAALILLSDWAR
jgi:hypothetical protein